MDFLRLSERLKETAGTIEAISAQYDEVCGPIEAEIAATADKFSEQIEPARAELEAANRSIWKFKTDQDAALQAGRIRDYQAAKADLLAAVISYAKSEDAIAWLERDQLVAVGALQVQLAGAAAPFLDRMARLLGSVPRQVSLGLPTAEQRRQNLMFADNNLMLSHSRLQDALATVAREAGALPAAAAPPVVNQVADDLIIKATILQEEQAFEAAIAASRQAS